VLGLLVTSIASGQLIARTGRYKVYPILGTAIMAVAMFLLSRLDETTSTIMMNIDFFILGISLGLIIQVLVIAVQNTVGYSDLGAALGAVPTQRTSAEEAERVVSRLCGADLRRFGYAKLAREAGLDLSAGACWLLTRLARQDASQRHWLEDQLAGWSPDQNAELEDILVTFSHELTDVITKVLHAYSVLFLHQETSFLIMPMSWAARCDLASHEPARNQENH
jgi:hypothetical protein